MFERSLELATELGLLSGRTEQILDSTPMLGAAAVQDTVTLIRSSVRELLDAVKVADPQAAGELRGALRFDYSQPRVKPEGEWQDRDARMALLAEVARDAERALRAVETEERLIATAAVAEAASLAREIIGQEFEVGDELPRLRRGRHVRQIVSAHDPEMRHGRQTQARPSPGTSCTLPRQPKRGFSLRSRSPQRTSTTDTRRARSSTSNRSGGVQPG